MTTATMALAELAEKGADVDVLRQMVQFMAQRLMELDVEGRCGAAYDEKNPERLNSRNGYRERTWDTPTARYMTAMMAPEEFTRKANTTLGERIAASTPTKPTALASSTARPGT